MADSTPMMLSTAVASNVEMEPQPIGTRSPASDFESEHVASDNKKNGNVDIHSRDRDHDHDDSDSELDYDIANGDFIANDLVTTTMESIYKSKTSILTSLLWIFLTIILALTVQEPTWGGHHTSTITVPLICLPLIKWIFYYIIACIKSQKILITPSQWKSSNISIESDFLGLNKLFINQYNETIVYYARIAFILSIITDIILFIVFITIYCFFYGENNLYYYKEIYYSFTDNITRTQANWNMYLILRNIRLSYYVQIVYYGFGLCFYGTFTNQPFNIIVNANNNSENVVNESEKSIFSFENFKSLPKLVICEIIFSLWCVGWFIGNSCFYYNLGFRIGIYLPKIVSNPHWSSLLISCYFSCITIYFSLGYVYNFILLNNAMVDSVNMISNMINGMDVTSSQLYHFNDCKKWWNKRNALINQIVPTKIYYCILGFTNLLILIVILVYWVAVLYVFNELDYIKLIDVAADCTIFLPLVLLVFHFLSLLSDIYSAQLDHAHQLRRQMVRNSNRCLCVFFCVFCLLSFVFVCDVFFCCFYFCLFVVLNKVVIETQMRTMEHHLLKCDNEMEKQRKEAKLEEQKLCVELIKLFFENIPETEVPYSVNLLIVQIDITERLEATVNIALASGLILIIATTMLGFGVDYSAFVAK